MSEHVRARATAFQAHVGRPTSVFSLINEFLLQAICWCLPLLWFSPFFFINCKFFHMYVFWINARGTACESHFPSSTCFYFFLLTGQSSCQFLSKINDTHFRFNIICFFVWFQLIVSYSLFCCTRVWGPVRLACYMYMYIL